MAILSPSLLSADFLNLSQCLKTLDQEKDLWLHLDIMDNHFVPNLTFGQSIIKSIAKATSIPLDVHLMIQNSDQMIEDLSKTPIHNLTVHVESCTHLDRTIQLAKKYFPSVGLAFNPGTSFSQVSPYILKNVDLVLLMTVNPGFGGQKFIEPVLKKIEELELFRKTHNASFSIQVDGGINQKTISKAYKAGARNFVAGSFVFDSIDPNKQIEILRKEIISE